MTQGGEENDCGNGVVNEGEECDDGNSDNSDSCVSGCIMASCGDTFLQMGEECDDGNMEKYDGCSEVCQDEYIIFVTKGKWYGNLGAIAADSKCAKEAKDAGLYGKYVAWLSNFELLVSFHKAWGDLPSGEPLILTTGDEVVDNAESLVLGNDTELSVSINRDASGGAVMGRVWTGTRSWKKVGPDCKGWNSSSDSEKGVAGYTDGVGPNWTDAGPLECNNQLPLYCFRRKD